MTWSCVSGRAAGRPATGVTAPAGAAPPRRAPRSALAADLVAEAVLSSVTPASNSGLAPDPRCGRCRLFPATYRERTVAPTRRAAPVARGTRVPYGLRGAHGARGAHEMKAMGIGSAMGRGAARAKPREGMPWRDGPRETRHARRGTRDEGPQDEGPQDEGREGRGRATRGRAERDAARPAWQARSLASATSALLRLPEDLPDVVDLRQQLVGLGHLRAALGAARPG